MNIKNSMLMALATLVTTAAAPAAETVWPTSSASDFSVHLTLQSFRIYADHCSANVPQLKPEFENLMQDLSSRIQGLSKGLLASDEFKGMQARPVPAQLIDAFKDSFHDSKLNFERRDPASICQKTLQSVGEMDDEALKSGLTEGFRAVQNMIQNLEKAGVR
jgi:hypothetical protein